MPAAQIFAQGKAHAARRTGAGEFGIGIGENGLRQRGECFQPGIHIPNHCGIGALLRCIDRTASALTAERIFHIAGDDYLALNDLIVTSGNNLYDGRVFQ